MIRMEAVTVTITVSTEVVKWLESLDIDINTFVSQLVQDEYDDSVGLQMRPNIG